MNIQQKTLMQYWSSNMKYETLNVDMADDLVIKLVKSVCDVEQSLIDDVCSMETDINIIVTRLVLSTAVTKILTSIIKDEKQLELDLQE